VLLIGSAKTKTIRICDAFTGKLDDDPAFGCMPFSDRSMMFSPDSWYFWAEDGNDFYLILVTSPKTVLTLRPPQPGNRPCSAFFAPDSSALALLWRTDSATRNVDCLQIIELPNGKERSRLSLQLDAAEICRWVGNRLWLAGDVDAPVGASCHRRYVFDWKGNSIDKAIAGPLLTAVQDYQRHWTKWLDGPDWVAHYDVSTNGNGKWDEWREWLFRRLGINKVHRRDSLTFLDVSTGKENKSIDFSSNLIQDPIIASNGKRIACLTEGGIIEVWDTDPPTRLPWAAVAGIASAGLVLLIGRWRSRRQSLGGEAS
jgi:hypothetical protein